MALSSTKLYQPEVPGALTVNEIVPLAIVSSAAVEPSINIFPPNKPFSWSLTIELDGFAAPFVAGSATLTFTGQADMLVGGNSGPYDVGSVSVSAPTSVTPTKAIYKVTGTCPTGIPVVGTYMMTVALTSKVLGNPTLIAGFDQILIQVADGT